MRGLLLFFSLILFIPNGLNSNNGSMTPDHNGEFGLKEKFKIKGFNSSVTINLNPDFSFSNISFSRGCVGGYYIKIVTGKYNIIGTQMTFYPEKIIISRDDIEPLPDKLVFKDTLDYYDSDSTKIQKRYWLVQLNDFKFLVSESPNNFNDEYFYKSSNFISLANLYNSRERQSTQENLLSSKDSIISFFDLDINKNIPNNWKDYFLENPIVSKLESVKMIKNDSFGPLPNCKLDKGADSGIKIGMRFYAKSISDDYLEVNEVFNKFSKGLYFSNKKIKRGIILSTEK